MPELPLPEQPPISLDQVGAFVIVHYRGRQSGDLYLALKDEPVHCCQCDTDIAGPDITDHVWSHAPKRLQAKRVKMARELLGEQGGA